MNISVTKQKKLWWGISSGFVLAGLIAMLISFVQYKAPLRPGLDFTGGTRLQFELDCSKPGNCDKPIELSTVRQVLGQYQLADSSIQLIGAEQKGILIRTKPLEPDKRNQLQTALTQKIGAFDPQKTQIDSVGPTIGRDLLTSGLISLLMSFVGIGVYLGIRFRPDYAVFAIVALFHDILITLGFFSILGLLFGTEVDSLFVVAILTIAGFSVTDTVVIYDRIRENSKLRGGIATNELVDDSVNQSLTRSLNTILAALLPLFSLFVFGGETLKNFSLALIVGFTMGAYSSIFIASPLYAWWHNRKGRRPQTEATS